MGKIAFVFAGQGAQYPGMGKALYESSPAARAVFYAAEAERPGTLAQCFEGDKETLSRTLNTQPCLYAVDLACARALEEQGVRADVCAGFSLGEIAAAAFSGLLAEDDAMRLVCRRAELMDACSQGRSVAMAAVLRLTAQQVEALCDKYPDVYPVNYNCPGQTVVSGDAAQIDALINDVTALRGRAMKLAVSGAFHSPYMHEAAVGLSDYMLMRGLRLSAHHLPLYANCTAQPYGDDAEELLARQVESPVLWEKTVRNMLADGVDAFVECGAGKTLSGLIKKIAPEATVCRVEDPVTLMETLTTLGGRS